MSGGLQILKDDNPYPEINAYIHIYRELDAKGEVIVTAQWVGDDVVGIPEALLADADEQNIRRDGDKLTICQFELKIIGYYPAYELYLAKRVSP